MVETNPSTVNPVFNNEKVFFDFTKYTDKLVEVSLSNNKKLEGMFYCVDPITCSIIVIDTVNTGDVVVINSECITDLKCISSENYNAVNCDNFFMKVTKFKNDYLKEIKSKLKHLLEEHLFSVVEEDDLLKINDICTIYPPYSPENCICIDTIQLELIQDLMKQINISSFNEKCGMPDKLQSFLMHNATLNDHTNNGIDNSEIQSSTKLDDCEISKDLANDAFIKNTNIQFATTEHKTNCHNDSDSTDEAELISDSSSSWSSEK